MSSPTQPITGRTGPVDAGPVALVGDFSTFLPELALVERSPLVRIGRVDPPHEVLDQIAFADAAMACLARRGQRVAFCDEQVDGITRIELQSLDGVTLRTLSAAEAIALACGDGAEED